MNIENMTKEELEKLKQELEGKKLKIGNDSKNELKKSFVESMSEAGRINRENIQSKREQRYEEMISDLPEIESPMSRHHQ